MKPVTLEISFPDLLLDVKEERTRKSRWAEWKDLAKKRGHSDCLEMWTDTDCCTDCDHCQDDWCVLAGLPCTVNPILAPAGWGPGMACCGLGNTARQNEPFPWEIEKGEQHA